MSIPSTPKKVKCLEDHKSESYLPRVRIAQQSKRLRKTLTKINGSTISMILMRKNSKGENDIAINMTNLIGAETATIDRLESVSESTTDLRETGVQIADADVLALFV